MNKINNTQRDVAQDIDIVMPMYNLIKYSDFIRTYQEVYNNTIEVNQLYKIRTILLIFLLIARAVFCSNLNSK